MNPPALQLPYLLVIHIPLFVDANGARWLDRLWAIDLLRHTTYIAHLTVACPIVRGSPPADAMRLPDDVPVTFVPVRPADGVRGATRALPHNWPALWGAIGRAQFVHSAVGGWWPFSLGNLTAFIAGLRRKPLFIIVESSPWRLMPGVRHSVAARIKAWLAEHVNRWCIGATSLAVFTHEQYKRDLMPARSHRGHVIPASWIDEQLLTPSTVAERAWQQRLAEAGSSGPLRLLCAARLLETKGIRVLIDAMQRLAVQPTPRPVELHIIGEGELLSACREAAAASRSPALIRVLDPVAYGEPFMALLRQYHAVVVPNLTDEQPRIVFDAYSQGLPVLGSDTDGLRDCVAHGRTGLLCPPGDAAALAALIGQAAGTDLAPLQRMGLAGLTEAAGMTHQAMHRRRHELLLASGLT